MDTVLELSLTTDGFLAWEDRQEARHEFDGGRIIPITGGSVAHQEIVFNLRALLGRALSSQPFRALQEMRLRIGDRIRYPDVIVCQEPLDQTTRALTDAVAIFEVLSDDTATTDRVEKLLEYSERGYVLLEQTAIAATVFQREAGWAWIASAHVSGALTLPGLEISLVLAELYQGLTFTA